MLPTTAALQAPGALGYNVDGLVAVGDSLLLAALSSFTGRYWTGAVGLLTIANDAGEPRLQSLLELRAGVPAVACLALADEFTGRRIVASGSDDGSLSLYYVTGGGQLELTQQSKVVHDAAVRALAAAPGDSCLASASADGTLRLWDCTQLVTATAQLGAPSSSSPGINGVAWTEDPHVVASAGGDGRVCLWDSRQLGGTPAAAPPHLGAPALSVVAAASAGAGGGQLLVVGDQLGRVSLYDSRSCGQPLQQRELHSDAVHAVAASSGGGGGSLVASAADDGSVLLLDCGSLQASCQLEPARRDGEAPLYVRALAWAGNGSSGGKQQRLYRGGWDQVVAPVPL